MQKLKQHLKKHQENIKKISKIKILEYELKQHHWLMIIGGSLSIAFLILVFYFSNVLAYNASSLIGQTKNSLPVFTTAFENNCFPNQSGLSTPLSTEIDYNNHRLFVADYDNDRVIIYNLDENNNLLDHVADNVFGQDSLSGYELNGIGEARMNGPSDLVLDQASSTLYVSDRLNQRVLVFNVEDIVDGESAINVLGKSNFSSTTSFPYSASLLTRPIGLELNTTTKKLFVADYHRVVIFDVNEITDGEPAINVLGQNSFITQDTAVSQTKFRGTTYLTLENNTNRLFVSDNENARVLIFDVNEITDGEPAINVLGQSDFISRVNDSNIYLMDPAEINAPEGLEMIGTDILMVANYSGKRVLLFDVTEIINGEDAVQVLGQSDLASYSPSGINKMSPKGIKYNSSNNKIYVSDSSNNRILIYDGIEIENGEAVVDVLGHINGSGEAIFDADYTNNCSVNELGFKTPGDLVLDTINHRLFVSDYLNSRILVFDLAENNELLDQAADYVLGQENFNTLGTWLSASSLSVGRIEAMSYLFVTDYLNSRVLIYEINNLVNNQQPINVLGQPDMQSIWEELSPTGLSFPSGIYFDETEKWLFVSDWGNSRVVVYNLADGITNGESAINVLGQPDFETNVPGTSASQLNFPGRLTFEGQTKKLFVSDTDNNRVVVYNLADGITNGELATNVLGQENFTDSLSQVTANKFSAPNDVAIGFTTDTLFVSDGVGRILVFDISSIQNGEEAIAVIGQDNFISSVGGVAVNKISYTVNPVVADLENQRLYVSDSNNNRVLTFDFVKITNSLPAATLGENYNQIVVSNFQGSVSSEITSGSLPPGLTFDGVSITGMPTTVGIYSFTVRSTDNFGEAGYLYDQQQLTIEVTQNLIDWQYRKKIIIDHEQVLSDLENFPVLVSFNTDNDLATKALTDGSDLVFVSSDVEWSSATVAESLDYQVESYNSVTGELLAWVKIPNLSASQDTEIYLYYGNENASTGLESFATWNNNFKMVQHLEESCGGLNCIVDDSANSHSGTAYRNLSIYNLGITGGKIGRAQTFEAVNGDNIIISNSVDFDVASTSHSFSAWFKETSTTTLSPIIFRLNGGTPGSGYYLSSVDGGLITVNRSSDSLLQIGAVENSHSLNDWHYIVATVDLQSHLAKLYLDSQEIGVADSNFGDLIDYVGYPLNIGGRANLFNFNGQIDEVRLLNSALSEAWISAEYNNQNNPEDFYSLGSEQTQSGQGLANWNYRKKIFLDGPAFTGSNLKDFPVLVKLVVDQDLVNHAKITGDDILFMPSNEDWSTGNTNERYSFQIESYNSTTGELLAWVKLSNLDTTAENYFYLYYGNSVATSLASEHVIVDNSTPEWLVDKNNIQTNPVDFYYLSPELSKNAISLSNWLYRKEVTVESDFVGSNMPNLGFRDYPVHLNLSADADLAAKAEENGIDILIMPESIIWESGTTNDRYQFNVISYTSSTGALEAYVNLPYFGNSDARFYIYYGNDSLENSFEDLNTQNGSSLTVQSLVGWQETIANNNNPEIGFYTLAEEEFYNQSLYHLKITGQDRMSTYGSQIITITLKNDSDQTGTLFNGLKTAVFSGARANSDNVSPTCTNYNNEDIAFGQNTVINFINGVSNCVLKLYYVENTNIDGEIGNLNTNGSMFYGLDVEVSSSQNSSWSTLDSAKGSFVIDQGSSLTNSRYVSLSLNGGLGVSKMAVANDESFDGIDIESYQTERSWLLSIGDGLKTVYLKYWYGDGSYSGLLSRQILLNTKPKIDFPEDLAKITEMPFVIKGTARTESKVEVSVAGTVYGVQTNASGDFEVTVLDQLIPGEYVIKARQYDKGGEQGEETSRKIVLVNQTTKEVIATSTEAISTNNNQENLSTDLGIVFVNQNQNAVNNLSKNNLGSPTVEKMNENIETVKNKEAFLLVLKNNSVNYFKEQINGINTVPGEDVEILLRLKEKTHSVVGKLYQIGDNEKITLKDKFLNYFVGSAKASSDEINKELVDAYIFDYDEQHNVYRTSIKTSEIGNFNYELAISVNNEDGSRVEMMKKIKTSYSGTISVDNGFVNFARIEVFKYNVETKIYDKWPAELYGADNPVYSNKDGKYAIQLPPGSYYFNIDAAGYKNLQSKIFTVSEPQIIDEDFVLNKVPYSWWFRFWNWFKMVLEK